MNSLRQRAAQFCLFLLPLTLLFGESPLVRLGSVPVYGFEALTLILLLLWAPDMQEGARKRITTVSLPVKVGALLLIPALATAVWVASSQRDALGAAKAWFIIPMLLGLGFILSGVRARELVWGVIAHALIQVGYGLWLLPSQEEHRLIGTFTSPNFLAAVLTPALLLSFLLPARWRWVSVAVLAYGLYMTQSLGGFLGLGAGAVYLAFLLVKDIRARLVLGVIGLLVLIVGGNIAWHRFANNPRSSLSSRQEIWKTAVYIGKEHPVTGIGLRSFDSAYEDSVGKVVGVPIEWSVPEPHNLYLAFWLDLSLLGLVAMAVLIIGSALSGTVAGAAVVAIAAHGLVDTPIFKLELAVLFWLYVALAHTMRGRNAQDLLA